MDGQSLFGAAENWRRVALAALAATALVGCGSGANSGGGPKHTIDGTLTVVLPTEESVPWLNDLGVEIGLDKFNALLDSDETQPCPSMPGEWGSLQDGRVTIRNQEGEVIATGSTNDGLFDFKDGGEGATAWCTLSFEIPDVPGADFYTIDVEGLVEDTASQQELRKENWKVGLEARSLE